MRGKRFAIAAGVLAICAGGQAQAVMAADLFPPPPEKPPEHLPPAPPPAPPPQAYIAPPPVVIYSFPRPFPYRAGCGSCCGSLPGYPYYIPCANHPPSYYRPYYNHHLGLETNYGPCGGNCGPGVAGGWGGYGYK